MFQPIHGTSKKTSLIPQAHCRSQSQWDPKNNNFTSKKELSRSMSMEEDLNFLKTSDPVSRMLLKDLFTELLPSTQLLSQLMAENSKKLSEILKDNSLDPGSSIKFDSFHSFFESCISEQRNLKNHLKKYSERSIRTDLQKEKETKGEIITKINQVKHDLILANFEIKQSKLHIEKLHRAIDSLEEINQSLMNPEKSNLKSSSIRETSEDLSHRANYSFISLREDKDEETSPSEKPHLLSCNIKELKNKDMLWSDFGERVSMLIEEIDRKHCEFEALPIIKENLKLLKIKNKSKSMANLDSFINHIIQTPALVEHHLESLTEELNEKEETIKTYKKELDIAKKEIERLNKHNLSLREDISPEKQVSRTVQRRSTLSTNRDPRNRLNTNPLESLENILQSKDKQFLEKCMVDTISKVFVRCKNLYASYTALRNRLESNQQLLVKLELLLSRLGSITNPFSCIRNLISEFDESGFLHIMSEKVRVLARSEPENTQELVKAIREHDKEWALTPTDRQFIIERGNEVSIGNKAPDFDILVKLDYLSQKVTNITRSLQKAPLEGRNFNKNQAQTRF